MEDGCSRSNKGRKVQFPCSSIKQLCAVKGFVEWAVPLIVCLARVFFKRLASKGEFTGYRDNKSVVSRVG